MTSKAVMQRGMAQAERGARCDALLIMLSRSNVSVGSLADLRRCPLHVRMGLLQKFSVEHRLKPTLKFLNCFVHLGRLDIAK
jgi:hypothetical protein